MYFIAVAVAVCAGLVCGHASGSPAAGGSDSCQAKMTAFPFDPSSKCCTSAGQGDNAIDQHPWAVLIEYETKKTNGTKTLCVGSLISGKYVLTSAHCLEGPVLDIATPVAVRLGEFDLNHEGRDCEPVDGGGEDCNDEPTRIAIETTTPHQLYAPGHPSMWSDIGLIRLKEVAPYTDFIRPICLPTKNLESNPPDHPLYAVSWYDSKDINRKLKKIIEAPFVNQNKCKAIYDKPGTVLAEGQLCAGGIEGMDTCKGDAGGPLVYENQGISELVGVVSFGVNPCGQKDIPTVYTNVYTHLDWIKTIIVA